MNFFFGISGGAERNSYQLQTILAVIQKQRLLCLIVHMGVNDFDNGCICSWTAFISVLEEHSQGQRTLSVVRYGLWSCRHTLILYYIWELHTNGFREEQGCWYALCPNTWVVLKLPYLGYVLWFAIRVMSAAQVIRELHFVTNGKENIEKQFLKCTHTILNLISFSPFPEQ